jgi:hypothetical protein
MKVKIIVTEDNGTITENEGDAVIFCLRQGDKNQDMCGMVGEFSLKDIDRMGSVFENMIHMAVTQGMLELFGGIEN